MTKDVSKRRRQSFSKVRKFPPEEDLAYPIKLPSTRGLGRSINKTGVSRAPVRPTQRQGKLSTIQPIVSESRQKELNQLALSVHYLQTQLPKEIRAAGFSRTAPVYEIEDLSGSPGVIRKKSQKKTCPIDGKPGSAYVHCVEGVDNVGDATHMLSYSWKYAIGDIIDTLVDFCDKNDKNPKRTYVWICCLCINQHRVVKQTMLEEKGTVETETVDFLSLFGDRVTSIGTIVAMMAPWSAPTYLTRVWCVFEIYTAYQKGCNIIIAMPPAQTKALEKDLLFGNNPKTDNLDRLYEVLASTKVQNAKATFEKDRIAILDIVKVNPGYAILNNRVNELLRGWIRGVITQLVAKKEAKRAIQTQSLWSRYFLCGLIQVWRDIRYANFCHLVGVLLNNNEENDAALESIHKAKSIRENTRGENHPDVALSLSIIGIILYSKGDYDASLEAHERALKIRQSALGKNHLDTATSHRQIGAALEAKGLYQQSLDEHRKALAIRRAQLKGENHEAIGESYGSISSVMEEMGDYDSAIEHCRKAIAIRETCNGHNHPDTASLYGILGSQLFNKGNYDGALEETRKALAIEENILGKDHTDTAASINNIGMILKAKGDLEGALVEYERALAVFESYQRKYPEALEAYRKGLKIKQAVLGPDHPDVATSYNNIGSVLHEMGRFDEAVEEHKKALKIREEVYGANHYKLVGSYNNIGGALQSKGDYEGALDALRTSLDITEATLGKRTPEAKELLDKIYWLLRATA
ncbi:Kinesin light chain [Seminavis robusta]|uniref:Kinesin light chain n=1 Tax=Seminavis robusta TaxID=568900 RepID=A0A9N8I018_9STRA|nr:Kinesin light chain [Seminavis robusta]|eukprot:Sro3349_g347050.1 Kinesin light chain (753) ;mRNA; f:1032-3454